MMSFVNESRDFCQRQLGGCVQAVYRLCTKLSRYRAERAVCQCTGLSARGVPMNGHTEQSIHSQLFVSKPHTHRVKSLTTYRVKDLT